MKIISGIFGLIILLLAVSFALSNREDATVNLWPLSNGIEAPLYLLSLGTLFFGVVMGAILGWISMFPYQLRTLRLHKDLKALNQRLEDMQQTIIVPPKTNMSFVGLGQSLKSKWRFGGPGL